MKSLLARATTNTMASEVARNKVFGGSVLKLKHASAALGCDMNFTVFLPETQQAKTPVLFFLAGLTCNEDTFAFKAGAFRAAALHGIALVAPDTSPRGTDIAGEHDDWDFGSGAGFYLDATTEKFARNYNMRTYVVDELRKAVLDACPQLDGDRISVAGHSMGGHGALTLGITYPDRFRSISAFAPIANPMQCPWGVKAFTGYLGEDRTSWEQYDASVLLKRYSGSRKLSILVDQGTEDKFFERELLTHTLEEGVKANTSEEAQKAIDLTVRMQEGYDHSYYFIQTFIDDHIAFHAKHLTA